MSNAQSVDPMGFIASFKEFMDQMVAQAPVAEEPIFLRRLRDHFGQDPAKLTLIGEEFAKSEHPNLFLALTDYLNAAGRSSELIGLASSNEHMAVKLAQLTVQDDHGKMQIKEGPVMYTNFPLNDDRVLTCVRTGLYLICDGERRLAVLLSGASDMGFQPAISIEVMADDHALAEEFLRSLRAAIRRLNVYRGHVISLEYGHFGVTVRFHHLPTIEREKIILPQGVIERIERQTVRFARLGEKLRAAGRHLKRGLLLYGPPGTGKTLTAMYLASQMPERTIILMTGHSLGLIEQSCAMARLLQPATIILEDVDLIAEERTHQDTGTSALLFELLNQMDGLADDADILFLLTTNRPDILEPALATRPGRIDQAIEIPLPDSDCRRRLFDLFSMGMDVRLSEREPLIERTEGVSAAFVRELMRKAALFAADEGGEIVVEDRHVAEALHEMVVEGGELTKRLLGVGGAFAHGGARDVFG